MLGVFCPFFIRCTHAVSNASTLHLAFFNLNREPRTLNMVYSQVARLISLNSVWFFLLWRLTSSCLPLCPLRSSQSTTMLAVTSTELSININFAKTFFEGVKRSDGVVFFNCFHSSRISTTHEFNGNNGTHKKRHLKATDNKQSIPVETASVYNTAKCYTAYNLQKALNLASQCGSHRQATKH